MQIPRSRLATPGLAVIAVAIALAGCGGSEEQSDKRPATVAGEQRGILGTVDALQTASREGDGERICAEIFTTQLVRSIEKSAKRSCGTEVKDRLFTPDAVISVGRDIKVTGSSATASIREQNDNVSKLFLLKQSGLWRIDRVVAQAAA